MQINAIFFRFSVVLLLSLLASCSSKQAVTPSTGEQTIDEISTEATNLSAQQHVELAQTVQADQALAALLTATKLFYKEQNYLKALWLADKVIPMVDDKTPNHIQENIQLSFIKASSLQHLGYYDESRLELERLNQYAKQNNIKLSASYYRLLHAAFQEKQRPISALNALLYAFDTSKPDSQDIEKVTSIWHEFISLSQWQLNIIEKDKAPNSDGWVKLTTLANKYGGNQEQRDYHLKIWLKKFKKHPANIIAKQLVAQDISHKNINNIAVILPLTGKQQTAGLAIQQGILASFANDPDKKLHFVDSNTVNWYGLTNEFSSLDIDYVIGPLLKNNVDKYITHTSVEVQSQNNYIRNSTASTTLFDLDKSDANKKASDFSSLNLNTDKNLTTHASYLKPVDSNEAITSYLQPQADIHTIDTLLLNIPAMTSLTDHHTVLSMRPEDEAKQAAATLSRKNFQHPIVLSQQNKISKRIAQAFVKQWQQVTGNTIEIVYYDTGSQMQANIKSSLAVDKSKARINGLKRKLNKSIKTQTRNRRDIDMIYLVGNPEQTRLVKPYIEVNISPFADIIPVFASSRSHSTTIDYSSNSDLQGLTFTEIPWLLTENQDTKLAALSQELWPKRSDSLSRLFAMGFDSYQLTKKIPLMQQAPYLQHWGQTGILKLSDNNILTRSLLWGEYKRNKVISIAME